MIRLVLSLFFLPAALGQAPVDEAASVGEEIPAPVLEGAEDATFRGFLIVLTGGDQFVGKTRLSLELTDASKTVNSELLDDGSGGDPVAGDGVFGGSAAISPGVISLRLLDGDLEVATGSVEVNGDLSSPSLRLSVAENTLAAIYQSDGPDSDAGAPGALAIGEAVPTGQEIATGSGAPTPVVGSRSPWLGRLILLGGVLLGFVIARQLRGGRRGPLPLSRVGTLAPVILPRSLMPARKGQRVWTAPDAGSRAQIVRALAERLAHGGPVLLLAVEGSREVHAETLGRGPAVHWLEGGRADLDQVLGAVAELELWGEVALVIEGLGALEAPDADESPDAVFQDLLEELKTPLIMVTTPEVTIEGMSGPVFERAADGYRVGSETVLSRRGTPRLEWAAGGNATG